MGFSTCKRRANPSFSLAMVNHRHACCSGPPNADRGYAIMPRIRRAAHFWALFLQ